jgi:hypothetical protein
MTSIRQQKKKAKKLADKQAKKAALAAEQEGAEDTVETEEPVVETPVAEAPVSSQFAKEGLAGIAPEGSDIKELPLETAAPAAADPAEQPKDIKPEDKKAVNLAGETAEQVQARRKKCADFLNERWEIRSIDPTLEEELTDAQSKKDRRYGDVVEMILKNGHTVGCYDNFAGQGYQFIGVAGKKAEPLDDDDARAIVAAAKSKGWEKIKLHGTKEDKDRLWLEAMRQGVATNYTPTEGSPVLAKWEKEYESMIDKNASGVRQDMDKAPEAEVAAPAAATAKTETAAPAAETAKAPETEAPGMTTKEEAEKPAAPTAASKFAAAPKGEESKTEAPVQTFSEYLQEKADTATNPNVKAGLLKMKEAHDSGTVKLGINDTFRLKNALEKNGYTAAATVFEEASNPSGKQGGGIKLPKENEAPTGGKKHKHQKHAR